jgi:hypothetical protein
LVRVGDDDLIAAWSGELLLGLPASEFAVGLAPVCRVFMTGACADFSEPSSEALLCSLAEGELTKLLVSVSVSD